MWNVQQILDEHDPESDLPPTNAPAITWAEAYLANAVLALEKDNAALRQRIDELALQMNALASIAETLAWFREQAEYEQEREQLRGMPS